MNNSSVEIAKPAGAIANVGLTWPACWSALCSGKPAFTTHPAFLPHWPSVPPLAVIHAFPGMEAGVHPPFEQRLEAMIGAVCSPMRHFVDQLLERHPTLNLTTLIATSNGDSGPLSTLQDRMVDATQSSSAVPPRLWESMLGDQLPGFVAKSLQRALPGATLSAACASALVAAAYAADRIRAGLSDAVLLVSADGISRVASAGFWGIGAMSATGCRPFDALRDGTTVGEGAVAMLLARAGVLKSSEIAAQLLGASTYCDAAHLVEPSSEGVIITIRDVLLRSGLKPQDVRAVYWHGTGTRQNDQVEAEAAQAVFSERNSGKIPPCTSTKGVLGHTMGASAAFNLLAACESLSTGILPPVGGTTESAFPWLNLTLSRPRSIERGPILLTALGFGGINAALAIGPATKRHGGE